jgi:hypothetical protein
MLKFESLSKADYSSPNRFLDVQSLNRTFKPATAPSSDSEERSNLDIASLHVMANPASTVVRSCLGP